MLKWRVDRLGWFGPRRASRSPAELPAPTEWESLTWTFLTSWTGGSCMLAPGFDIEDTTWRAVIDPHTGAQRTITAVDGIYGDLHSVSVWYIEHHSRLFVFAANEVTNGVFLVFVPSQRVAAAVSNELRHCEHPSRVMLRFNFGCLMRALRRPLIQLLVIALCGTTAMAQMSGSDPKPVNESQVRSGDLPSPDGRFAFVTSSEDDQHRLDLIETSSGKTLQRLAEEDSVWARWDVLWSPDSSKFAVMTRLSHASQSLDIYARNGADFVKITLPEGLEVSIPERLKRGKSFPHFANLNWTEAKSWRGDGSLDLTITTAIDGAAGSISAERPITVSFDGSNRPKVRTSSIRYRIERQ